MVHIWAVLSQFSTMLFMCLLVVGMQKIFHNRMNPKWQSYLWWVVILVAFLPPAFIGTGSLVNFKALSDYFRISVEMVLSSSYSSPWVVELSSVPLPILPSVMPTSITDVAFIGYVLWVFGSGLWFVCSYAGLRHGLLKAVVVSPHRVWDIAEEYHLPKPSAVMESRKAKTPFVVGIFRPKLVLPMGQDIDDGVILHELLHLKYKDIVVGWLSTMLRCLYPVLWPFCDTMDNDRERACDQRVLELLDGEQRRDYGRVLLSMLDNEAIHTAGATAMANGGKNIHARITSIANFKKYPQGMGLVSLCMVVVFALAMVGGDIRAQDDFDLNPVLATSVEATAVQSMVFGQNNGATTPAAALDFYTQGRYYDLWRKYESLAYLAAVTKPTEMENLYGDWWSKVGGNVEALHNAYRTGPIIRGLGAGDHGNYLCEIYFYKDQNGSNHNVSYRKNIVSLEENDGFWTVKQLSEEEGVIDGKDTIYWDDNHSPVVWVANVAGYHLEMSQIGQISVNAPLINGFNMPYQTYFPFDPNLHTNPRSDGKFWGYDDSFYTTLTNESGEKFDEISLTVDFTTDSQTYEINVKWRQPIDKGQPKRGAGGGGGTSQINGIVWEEVSPPISAHAVLSMGEKSYEVELTKEVRVP